MVAILEGSLLLLLPSPRQRCPATKEEVGGRSVGRFNGRSVGRFNGRWVGRSVGSTVGRSIGRSLT